MIITPVSKDTNSVMPDLTRHPDFSWIPASAGMTKIGLLCCHDKIQPVFSLGVAIGEGKRLRNT